MAKLHKVLAIARLEESREPLYVFTTELQGQGYVVETAHVRFKDEEDGETSYAFNMAILEMDLPEPPASRAG